MYVYKEKKKHFFFKSSVSTSAFVFDDFGPGPLIEGAFHLGDFSVSEYCEGSAPRHKIKKEFFYKNASFLTGISVDSLWNSVKFVLVK